MDINKTLVHLREELLYLKTAIFMLEQIQAGTCGRPAYQQKWLELNNQSSNGRTFICGREPAASDPEYAKKVTELIRSGFVPESGTAVRYDGTFFDISKCSSCGEGSRRFVEGRPLCVKCAETGGRQNERPAPPESTNPSVRPQTA